MMLKSRSLTLLSIFGVGRDIFARDRPATFNSIVLVQLANQFRLLILLPSDQPSISQLSRRRSSYFVETCRKTMRKNGMLALF
jgi:hypothetical protein